MSRKRKPTDIYQQHELANILGHDVMAQINGSEMRKLKADIKKGSDIKNSKILKNIAKRCPGLDETIQNIIAGKKTKVSRKSRAYNYNNNKKTHNNPVLDTGTPGTSGPDPVTRTKSRKKIKSKQPRNDDTDSDYQDDQDDQDDQNYVAGYVKDGFVVSDDSDLDDYQGVWNRTRMVKNPGLHDKLKNIHQDHKNSYVDLEKITTANFNRNDTMWLYKNFQRLESMEGKEKFDLEDKIEKRYNFLKLLQENNMYQHFNSHADRDIMKDVLESKHPEHVKKIILQKINNITMDSIEEYQKAVSWADTIINLPTETKSPRQNIDLLLKNLYKNLTLNMGEMNHVIKEIMQAVCTILNDPINNGYIIALVGPFGVGKTTISTLISKSIGMGFGQVSCGSINDMATIIGHSSCYIGSKPGIFTQIQIATQQLDNVILLDEMNELHDSKIISALIQILDKTQNNRFKDAFCPEVDIDLSKNLYIIAVNSLQGINGALKDRLKIVNVPGYDVRQKISICKNHVIPKIMTKTGIGSKINDQTIKHCIEKISPAVSGMRELERFFGDIYEKLLLIKHMEPIFFDLDRTFNVLDIREIDKHLIKKLTMFPV
jgi:ATP-dependent Lon protease